MQNREIFRLFFERIETKIRTVKRIIAARISLFHTTKKGHSRTLTPLHMKRLLQSIEVLSIGTMTNIQYREIRCFLCFRV